MDNFRDWLSNQLESRNWKQADLARASNLDSAVISNLINGKRGPGEDTCKAIARALGVPTEIVYRAAGLLDPQPPQDDIIGQILFDLGGTAMEGKLIASELVKKLHELYPKPE